VNIRRGEPWGSPEDSAPDLVVAGGDHDLAAAVAGAPPGVLVAFAPTPESDVARAIGLTAGAPPQGLALPMDALALGDGTLAVNAVIFGTAPDRLRGFRPAVAITLQVDGREEAIDRVTTVAVATGQWLRGVDLVPRGHPGDGRAEIQAYRLRRSERSAMRRRLHTGTHLPHPRIVTRSAAEIVVRTARPLRLEVDGLPLGTATTLRATLVPARYRLLI
jgi:YegS C-terminal NAD kinase beta sandwich-like domain